MRSPPPVRAARLVRAAVWVWLKLVAGRAMTPFLRLFVLSRSEACD